MPELVRRTLLLDTHVWIWVMDGAADRISPSALEEVRRASARGAVRVSAISVWEVAMLEAKGRVRFSVEAAEWVRRGLQAPGVRLEALSPEVLVESTRLPGAIHGDPADRMIVATARRTGATLVTRDAAVLAYAREGHLSALDAGA